jgi:hypothetical protein
VSWIRFHPLTRIIIVAASVVGLALFAGVERVGDALASMTPGGSFDDRCARLPPASVNVSLLPFTVAENTTTPFATLTRMSDDPAATHRTIGLTHASFAHRSSIEVKGLEDRVSHRACVRPQVNVELSLRPMTVYIAREYANDECRSRTIREHEQRHVDVYSEYAREAVAILDAQLKAILGTQPHFAYTVGDAQQALDQRIGTQLDAFMRESKRVIAERQARVDTPEEYARVSSACSVAVAK